MAVTFIVRFEDTDQTRHKESGGEDQLNGLRWLGLDWDESVDIGGPYGPYRQMERLDIYQHVSGSTVKSGHAYRAIARKRIWSKSGQSKKLAAKCALFR